MILSFLVIVKGKVVVVKNIVKRKELVKDDNVLHKLFSMRQPHNE